MRSVLFAVGVLSCVFGPSASVTLSCELEDVKVLQQKQEAEREAYFAAQQAKM